MKLGKRGTSSHKNASRAIGSSRRKFLRQSFAFAALTSSYSVVSLTDLACRTTVSPPGPGTLGGYYFGGDDFYYGSDDYLGGENFYWGYDEYYWSEPFFPYY
jgi:hypothetical protein